jgi:hypothetical protein
MPLLSRGDEAGFEAFKSVAPQSIHLQIDGLAHQFRKVEQPHGEGNLIEWKFVGAKRIGTMMCQNIYVSRTTRDVWFWFFTGCEVSGRMCFRGWGRWASDEAVFDELSADDQSKDPTCLRRCSELVDLLAQGKSQAVEVFRKNAARQDPESQANLEQAVKKFLSMSATRGRCLKRELVRERNFGGFAQESCYLLGWEGGGYCSIRFYLYRPAEDWKITGLSFDFDGDCQAMLGKVALDSKTYGTAPQTASVSKACERSKTPKVVR